MSVKKLALLGVASVATLGMSVSLAGGPAHHGMNHQGMNHHDAGFYVGVDLGATYNTTLDKTAAEWAIVDGDTWTSSFTFTNKRAPWGFSYGGTIGYQIDGRWSVELAFDQDQDQKATYYNTSKYDYYTYKHHTAHIGLKRSFHLDHDLQGFMTIGVAHTQEKLKETYSTGTNPADLKDNFWSPMAAAGVAYDLNNGLDLTFQYAFVMGHASANFTTLEHAVLGENTQRISVGLDYHFDM